MRVRHIFFVVLVSFLSAGCREWFFPPEVIGAAWPEGQTAAFGREIALDAMIQTNGHDPDKIQVLLRSEESLFQVNTVEPPVQTKEDKDRLRYRFRVTPLTVGEKLPLHIEVREVNKDRSHAYTFFGDVSMPPFFNPKGQTFLEMTESPPESIYGSKIHFWNGRSGFPFLVTGHAESGVCREASGILFNYALNSSNFDDNYFLGAGMASLSQDEKKLTVMSDKLKTLPLSPQDRGNLLMLVLDEKFSEIKSISQSLLTESETPPSDIDEFRKRFPILSKPVSQADLAWFEPWLLNYERVLDRLKFLEHSEWRETMKELFRLDKTQRQEVARFLNEFTLFAESNSQLFEGLNAIGKDKGLLKVESNELGMLYRDEMRRSIAFWLKGKPVHGRLALTDTSGKQPSHNGVFTMPFYNADTGQEVSFTLPKSAFAFPDGGSPLDLFRNSAQREMQRAMIGAATRMEDLRQEFIVTLENFKRDYQAHQANAQHWMQEKRTVTMHIYDSRTGRDTGKTETNTYTGQEYWLKQIEQAKLAGVMVEHFRQAAREIDERSNDPKFQKILEFVLLDSFLRGWDLSFMDNALSSPYQAWMQKQRGVTWDAILHQSRAQNLDLRPMVTENTVFQIVDGDNSYTIRPLFVVNLAHTTVHKTSSNALVYYQTPWNQRRFHNLMEKELSPGLMQRIQAGKYQPLGAANPTQSSKNSEPLDSAFASIADDLIDRALSKFMDNKEQRNELLKKAFFTAPEYTAGRLIDKLLDSWKEDSLSKEDVERFTYYEKQGEIDKDRYFKLLLDSKLPFPEAYLGVVLQLDKQIKEMQSDKKQAKRTEELQNTLSELKDLRVRILGNGQKIDANFMQQGLKAQAIPFPSERLQKYRMWRLLDAYERALSAATCLNKNKHLVGLEKINTGGDLRSALTACVQAIPLPKNSPTDRSSARGMEKELFETIRQAAVTIRDEIRNSHWDFDRLGRTVAAQDVQKMIEELVQPAAAEAWLVYQAQPSKPLFNALTRLMWHMGQFQKSLTFLTDEAPKHAKTEESQQIAQVLSEHNDRILQALVYSGGSLDRHLFGRKPSDWILRAENLDTIPVRVSQDASADAFLLPPTVLVSNKAVAVRSLTEQPQWLEMVQKGEKRFQGDDPAIGLMADGTILWFRDQGEQIRFLSLGNNERPPWHSDKILPEKKLRADLQQAGFTLIERQPIEHTPPGSLWMQEKDTLLVVMEGVSYRFVYIDGPKVPTVSQMDLALTLVWRDLDRLQALDQIMTDPKVSVDDFARQRMAMQNQLPKDEKVNLTLLSLLPYKFAAPREIFVETFLREDDGAFHVLSNGPGGPVLWYRGVDGKVALDAHGPNAVPVLENLTRKQIHSKSDDRTKFLHIGSTTSMEGKVTLQLGEQTVDFPVEEINRLIANPGADNLPQLDALFLSASDANPKRVVLFRDAFQRASDLKGPKTASGAGGDGIPPSDGGILAPSAPDPFNGGFFHNREREENNGHARNSRSSNGDGGWRHSPYHDQRFFIHPLFLAISLKQRYGHRAHFFLDDEMDLAKENIEHIPMVEETKTVAAYLPDVKEYPVDDRGAILNIKSRLAKSNVRVIETLDPATQQNIIVISGHNDAALEKYLDAHIKKGNFKDKYVALFTCYTHGSEAMNHRIIKEGGAIGVHFIPEKINPNALNAAMLKFVEGVNNNKNAPKNLSDWMQHSVQEAEKDLDNEGMHKRGLFSPLKNGIDQISLRLFNRRFLAYLRPRNSIPIGFHRS